MAVAVFRVNPIDDPRWRGFLHLHPEASIFHSPEWLRALQRTYDYEPVLYTTSGPGEPLENGIVFCRVESWLTGTRLVSLPFSDHCQPLADRSDNLTPLYELLAGCGKSRPQNDRPGEFSRTPLLREEQQREQESLCSKYRYIELRPLSSDNVPPAGGGFAPGEKFYIHRLDLRPNLDTLFGNFHRNCIQRKIQRAGREGLAYEAGRSESILANFYRLQILTRRRHRLPPQPMAWFRNLIECLGQHLTIRVASKDHQPIASILTLSFKNTLVYKYGCSDARFHNLGAMPLLFWRAVQEGKQQGAEEFDLGRSEIDNPGLVAFKERLGATRSPLVYFRAGQRQPDSSRWQARIVRRLAARLPAFVGQAAGAALYRHVG